MKVLVLGSGGMAGHVVSLFLRENNFEVETLSAHHMLDTNTHLVDVMNLPALNAILAAGSYDIVINCVGLLVKQSENRKDMSTFINSFLPHYLENYYNDRQTKLIHLSTDCVFSGEDPPYRENSKYDGNLFYDQTKALGEIINDKDLTFRMSIVGPDTSEAGIGLFNWFFAQTGEVSGYTKAMWNGITTIQLAKGIKAAIEQNLTGLYHLVPDISISKFELLNLFRSVFNRNDITVTKNDNVALDKTLINTRTDFDFSVPDYEIMIAEMQSWIDDHQELYKHYQRGTYGE